MHTGRHILWTLFLMIALLSSARGAHAGAAMPGETAPDFSLPDSQGRQVSLSDYKGSVVVIAFWAPWCTACREELPDLERLARELGGQGFAVIGISVDRSSRLVNNFIEHFGISFPVLIDTDKHVADEYGFLGLPASYVVDRQGVIAHRHLGYEKNALSTLKREIGVLLNKNGKQENQSHDR